MALLRNLKPGQVPKIVRPARFRGMAPDIDPQDLPEDQPYLSINTRLDGGRPVIRGGESKICNVGGRVTGLATHKMSADEAASSKSLFALPINNSSGSIISVFDDEFLPIPTIQTAVSNDASGPSAMAMYGGTLIFAALDGTDLVVKRYRAGAGPASEHPTILKISATIAQNIRCMVEHEGTLLLGLDGLVADGLIASFDGTTVTIEQTGLLGRVGGFGLRRDTAVALPSNSIAPVFGGVYSRSVSGVWSALIPTVAYTTVPWSNHSASFRDILYYAVPAARGGGDTGNLMSFNGTALTSIPRATTGIGAANSQIVDVSVFDGNLYYLWVKYDAGAPNKGNNLYVGKFDGTTWNPTFKDLTAQATYPNYLASGGTGAQHASDAKAMTVYRGSLVVSGYDAQNVSPNVYLYVSPPGADPSGTWSRLLYPVTAPTELWPE